MGDLHVIRHGGAVFQHLHHLIGHRTDFVDLDGFIKRIQKTDMKKPEHTHDDSGEDHEADHHLRTDAGFLSVFTDGAHVRASKR